MKRKLSKKDIPDIEIMLYEEEMEVRDVAKVYGYTQSSAFNTGLSSIGCRIVRTIKCGTRDKKI